MLNLSKHLFGFARCWVVIVALLLFVQPGRCRAAVYDPHVALPKIPKTTVRLTDFDGIGDGAKLNTEAFARAIEALAGKGGGRLLVPPGIWRTGPIQLRSNIELHLERGAVIQFVGDYQAYPLVVIDIKGEKEVRSTSPIFGQNLENIAITGEGIIDGGGDAWRPVKKGKVSEGEWAALVKSGGVLGEKNTVWWPSGAAMNGEKLVKQLQAAGSLNLAEYEPAHQFLRPRMLKLIDCKKVLLENITIQNPPDWTMNPTLCEDVSIRHVTVHNSPAAQNSDALDLESCRRAVIRDCTFDTGDDGICIKSGKDAVGRRIGVPTEDVLIEGCTVYHAHGGFTIGSEMSGGVRNLHVNNCTFLGTEIGLRFKSRRGRGGVVEKIFISNIRMANIAHEAISFNYTYGAKSSGEDAEDSAGTNIPPVTVETPQFRDFQIENVLCRGAQTAMALEGLPELPTRGITLKNVDITAEKGVTITDAEAVVFNHVRVENKTGEQLKSERVKNCKLELLK